MASGGILLEQGIPMRQQWMEHCWTALAGREAVKPMDGLNNEYSEIGVSKSQQFGFLPIERTELCEGDGN